MLEGDGAIHNLSVASRQASLEEKRKPKKRAQQVIEAVLDQGSRVTVNGKPLDPARSRRLKNHSKDFGWGYRGTGPMQLALAILLEVQGDEKQALRCYEAFHEERVSRMVGRRWTMETGKVRGLDPGACGGRQAHQRPVRQEGRPEAHEQPEDRRPGKQGEGGRLTEAAHVRHLERNRDAPQEPGDRPQTGLGPAGHRPGGRRDPVRDRVREPVPGNAGAGRADPAT